MPFPQSPLHNRYRIVRLIARGGMGAVYEAIDERLSNRVALKQTLVIDNSLLNSDLASEIDSEYIASLRRAFEREAKILAGLRHPNLPRVFDYLNDDQGQFLVMEFIPGDDLAAQLNQQNGPFPYDQVLSWADQLLDALDYLHTQQIIHRDIKPQNLKLTPRKEIVLLDFGLAKGNISLQTHVVATSSVYGYTQQYAPIEQIRGTGTDARSDLYALGATLYHLLTGTPPADALARVDALVNGQPDPLRPMHELNARIPPTVSEVLMQTLALNINERPVSAATLRADLRSVQPLLQPGGTTVAGLPPRPGPAEPSDYETIAYQRSAAHALPQPPAHAQGGPTRALPTEAAATEATPTQPVETPRSATPKPVSPPWSSSRKMFAIGGTLIGFFVIVGTIVALGQAGALPGSTTQTIPTAADVFIAQAETPTVQARPTQAQATATDPAVTGQVPTATEVQATATPPVDISARQTTTAASQIAAIRAEAASRADRHLTDLLGNATSRYDPQLEAGLLQNGYADNITLISGRRFLQPSQSEPVAHTWVRDLDYAISGYGYVLGNMTLLRNNTELFLRGVRERGFTPDVYNERGYDNNQAWDSRPNLIHAVYAYISKTGDWDFYREYREEILQSADWIVRLDTNDDGLPDRDIAPYGYYNSIENSVHHTYALAKCFAAYRELAALEQGIGEDGSIWEQRAAHLRESFHRPFEEGGYWVADQAWPVAWRNPGEGPVDTLETFGVFEALRSGLIQPSDQRYATLMRALHESLPTLMQGSFPLRLTLAGYPPELLRSVVRDEWKRNPSAPWIAGLAAPAYAAAGYPEDAQLLLQAYSTPLDRTNPLVPQLVAVEGTAQEGRGGAWSSAAWFMAVYGGHYGLSMTPSALVVQPHPFTVFPDDGVQNLSYQGSILQLSLDPANRIYRIQANELTVVTLRPMGAATRVRVNGGPPRPEETHVLQPGEEYEVRSE